MSDFSRQRILDRVRLATHFPSIGQVVDSYAALSRTYLRAGEFGADATNSLMIERLREYGAEVVETTLKELPTAIAAQLLASQRHTFVVPPGIQQTWRDPRFEWKIDHHLTTDEIEQTEGVVTACFCGVADSGTIALHHSPAEGRRILTLLPDWHLCILKASQIVRSLPEYFDRCQQPPALATFISGPSATADIEMTRIKGVHGPRFLNVILVHDQGASATATTKELEARTRSKAHARLV